MTDEPEDLYAVLGLASDASQDEISAAFRSLLRRYHPDTRAPGTSAQDAVCDAALQRILAAYGALRDPVLRAAYDTVYGHADERTALKPPAPSNRVHPVHVSRRRPVQDPPLRAGPVRWTPAR